MPAKTDSKAIGKLLTLFGITTEKETLVYDKYTYTVWKAEVGLTEADRTPADGSQVYDLTCEGFEEHCSAGKLTTYVCYDSKKYSNEVQRIDGQHPTGVCQEHKRGQSC